MTHLLDIYLDDHWAGAGAGEKLARRLARNNSTTSWAGALEDLANQVEEDDRTLASVRAALGVEGGGVKRRLAEMGERVSRLKLNGRLLSYSPLSRVVETEALIAGITAKLLLWIGLAAAVPTIGELASYEFPLLEQRATDQLEVLRRFHREAVAAAFTGDDGSLRA